MCILLGYTNWSEGNEETVIAPFILSSPITQVVMTAGKMATKDPLLEGALQICERAFGRTGVGVVAVGDFEGGGGQGVVGEGKWGLAALLPPVSPLSQPGGQAVLGSPAPR